MEWPVRKEMGRLVIKIRRRGEILFFMCVCLEPKIFYWFRKFDVCVCLKPKILSEGYLLKTWKIVNVQRPKIVR